MRNAIVVTAAFLTGLVLANCAHGGAANPEACMNRCEQDCPGKAMGPGDAERYFACVSKCEDKCGVEPAEE